MTERERDQAAFVEVVQRIQRIERAIERLCNVVMCVDIKASHGAGIGGAVGNDLELIKQYVQGKLDPAVQGTARFTLDG